VRVPVGKRAVVGCVVGHDAALDADTTARDVVAVLDDEPYLPPAVVELCGWVAEYYMAGPPAVEYTLLERHWRGPGSIRARWSLTTMCGFKQPPRAVSSASALSSSNP